ncbi:hypothetical protein ABPG75_012572 [Micractinium tetrahymenae]
MSLLKFFAGIDGEMTPLSPQDAATDLQDPFATTALLGLPPAQWPQSLKAVADLFPSSDTSNNLVFLVGDGGQISAADFLNLPQLKDLDRSLRYVWARKDAPGKNGTGDVLAVGPGDIHSTISFLQVVAWDPANQRFNYFQRQPAAKEPDPIQLLLGLMGGTFPSISNLFKVPFDIYSQAVKNLGIHMTGDLTTGGTVDIPGETDFAFLVPEPAFEDIYLINSLASKKLFSPGFLLCCLLTDFPNPIYSPARMKLMDYVPSDVAPGTTTAQLEDRIIGNIMMGASKGDVAAQEFVGLWEKEREEPLVQAAATAIQTYLTGASAKLATLAGVQDVLKLADFRRRAAFKFNNGLFEFSLTLPITPGGESVPDLAMKADGSVGREVPAFQGAVRAALTARAPPVQSKALAAAMAMAGCMGGVAARRAREGQGKCPLHFARCDTEHEA